MANTDMAATYALKKSLRKSVQQQLRGLSPDDIREQSLQVLRLVKESGVLDKARSVSCYLSMPSAELSTDGLIQHILERDIPLFVPYIPPPPSRPPKSSSSYSTAPSHTTPPLSQDMSFLRLYSSRDLAGCKRDKWGIPDIGRTRSFDGKDVEREDALSPSSPPLDLVLLPGLAFDKSFNRLGHGKGYYDRYIRRCREVAREREVGGKGPILVALALRVQMLSGQDSVPTTGQDELVDMIIHPDGIERRTM